jgi:hypothetical protein
MDGQHHSQALARLFEVLKMITTQMTQTIRIQLTKGMYT